MTDHVFRYEHLQVRLSVVNHERQADKLGHDRAGPRPGLDRLFRASLLRSLDLLEHLEIDKRTFFARATHVIRRIGVSPVFLLLGQARGLPYFVYTSLVYTSLI